MSLFWAGEGFRDTHARGERRAGDNKKIGVFANIFFVL
jgi:hypothetical protein